MSSLLALPPLRVLSFRAAATVAGLCVALLPVAALGAQLFHSPNDDGVPGSGSVPTGGVQSVFLYLDGGPSASDPGSACHDGLGDEICGFTFELTAESGLSFASFVPEPGADLLANFSGGSVRINGLDPVSPSPGPQRVGELQVNAVLGGEVALQGGETVGADLQADTLAPTTLISVPEPGSIAMLLAGSGLLAGLATRRRTR